MNERMHEHEQSNEKPISENLPELEIGINQVDAVAAYVREAYPNMQGIVDAIFAKLDKEEITPDEAYQQLREIN